MSEDFREDPVPPSRAERPGGPPDYPALDYGEEPPFPQAVTAAGVMWIAFGCLIVLYLAAATVLTFAARPNAGGQGEGAQFAGEVCGLGCVALFSIVFLFVGVQSVRGTARDALGNGIGSILFALIYLGAAAVQIMVGQIVPAAVAGLGGVLLLVAGVLALVGRSDYKLWRKAQKARLEQEAADRKARRRFRE